MFQISNKTDWKSRLGVHVEGNGQRLSSVT